jgi:hypothetical protein
MIEWELRKESAAKEFFGLGNRAPRRHFKGIVGATTALIGSLIGSGLSAGASALSASSAAGAQADAANHAADISRQNATDALNFQKQQYGNSLQMLNPYLQTGYGSLGILRNLMGIGGPASQYQGFNPQNAASSPTAAAPSTPVGRYLPMRVPPRGAQTVQGINPSVDQGLDIPPPDPTQGITTRSLVTNPDAGTFGTGGNAPQMAPPDPGTANSGLTAGNLQVPFDNGTGTTSLGMRNPDAGTFGTGGNAVAGSDPSGAGSFGSLLQDYGPKFVAPDAVTEQNDPGYQFRLDQGQKALENSAAARGGLLSGGTGKALQDYGQQYASNEYGNVYNRALGQYQQNYNIFQNDQANKFNRLASLAGLGQTSAGQLTSAGQSAANNISNIDLGSANQIGNQLNNAGAARGSGYVGVGNAISGGLNNLSMAALLQSLRNSGGAGV